MDDEDKPRRRVTHEIGQELSLLSVDELAERIALLEGEVVRLREAITRKRASRDLAEGFFKS